MKRLFFILAILAIILWQLPVDASTIAYYRFEEGGANATASTIVDSAGNTNGTASGSVTYRTDTPGNVVPLTGVQNTRSLQFSGGNVAFGSPFVLHNAYGDATLEFWIKYNSSQGHRSIFWTRSGDSDNNRFNITVNSNNYLGFDYREPNGNINGHVMGSNILMPNDTWSHVAVTRSGNTYRFYLNGVLKKSFVDTNPNLPTSTTWEISGRSTNLFMGYLDEIRLSDTALTPDQFLYTKPVPEPASLAMLALGMILLSLGKKLSLS